jgi:hypothetical protein
MRRHRDDMPLAAIAKIIQEWPSGRRGYGQHIAQEFGINIRTARRWIYETRKKGLLPAGTADRDCPKCNGTGKVRWNNPRDHTRPGARQ